jgi:hypothetical protein
MQEAIMQAAQAQKAFVLSLSWFTFRLVNGLSLSALLGINVCTLEFLLNVRTFVHNECQSIHFRVLSQIYYYSGIPVSASKLLW